MRKFMKPVALVSVMFAVVAAGSALYAADSQDHRMMGKGMMNDDGMMGMMGRTSRMMDHCSAMMRGGHGHRPNDQWRKHAPEDKG